MFLLAGIVLFGALSEPGRPPATRPPGAGLPPTAVSSGPLQGVSSLAAQNGIASGFAGEIAEEEARLAALRAERARLQEEIATLRIEAEERRVAMPGRNGLPAGQADGSTQPLASAAGGGAQALAAPALGAMAPQVPPERPLRIFVHHRANSPPGAAAAQEVARTLNGAGIEVQSVRTAPFVPSTPVVRYFHEEDQAAAAQLASRLGRGWAVQDFRAFVPQPPPRTLEVWLPASS